MSRMEYGPARRLVNTPRLHADIAILDQIDAANAMLGAEIVHLRQKFGGRQCLVIDRNQIATPIIDFNIHGSSGRLFQRPAPDKHVWRRLFPWILKHAALITYMKLISIGAVRTGLGN